MTAADFNAREIAAGRLTWAGLPQSLQAIVAALDPFRAGPKTLQAMSADQAQAFAQGVLTWQSMRGLSADGYAGPLTQAAFLERLPISLYWDVPPSRTLMGRAKLSEYVRSLGVDRLIVETHGQADRDDCFTQWTPALLSQLVNELDGAADVIAMVWPRATTKWADMFHERVARALFGAGCLGVEFDAEGGNWDEGDDLDHEAVGARLCDIADAWELLCGVTVHAGRMNPTISAHADYISVQCYPTGDKGEGIGERYGPGNAQRRGIAKARAIAQPDAGIVCAMPLYGQHHYPSPSVAMATSYRAAVEEKADRAAFWSAKHVERNDYALPFLRALR